MGRIIATGSVIVDLSLRVPALPTHGGDVIASAPRYDVGGGFNLIYAAVQQGAFVQYAGAYGSGPNGRLVLDALARIGVEAVQAPDPTGDTGLCVTLIDAQAERTFVTAPGVEAQLDPAQLSAARPRAADIVAVSGYDLAYAGAGAALAAWVGSLPQDRQVLVDPGPLVADIPGARWRQVVERTSVLTVNRREAGLLADADELAAAVLHQRIRHRHRLPARALLVVRHGADGCTYDGGPGAAPVTAVPSIAVRPVDSTGAGDTHTGVLLAGLLAGTAPYGALRRANIAAALSVTRSGPATAPGRSELDDALRRYGA